MPVVKDLFANAGHLRDVDSFSGWGRFPGGEHGNPFQYSRLEKSYGQRTLVDYSPWDHKESDTTEVTQQQQHM